MHTLADLRGGTGRERRLHFILKKSRAETSRPRSLIPDFQDIRATQGNLPPAAGSAGRATFVPNQYTGCTTQAVQIRLNAKIGD